MKTHFLYLVLLICLPFKSIGQQGVVDILFDGQTISFDSVQAIREFTYILHDDSESLTIDDAKAQFEANQFQKLSAFDDSDPGTDVYWITFSLKNRGEDTASVALYLGEEHDAQIYGAGEEKRVGTLVPANEKKGALPKGFLLREDGYSGQVLIAIAGGETRQIFIRTKRILHKAFPFSFKLYEPTHWNKVTAVGYRDFGQGMLQGILWTLIIYHLLLFLMIRDQTYLYYCLYVFGISIIPLSYFGYLHEIFFPNHPLVAKFLTQTAHFVTVILAFAFARSFVRSEQLLPKWDFRIQFLMKAMAAYLLMIVGGYMIFQDYRIIHYSYYLAIPLVLFGFFVCIVLFRTRDKVALYFAGATFLFVLTLLVTFLVTFLTYYGVIEGRPYRRFYIAQAGVVIHLLAFALGLGYRRRQKDFELQRATELDAMKSRFFTNISHEFRTPLTLIMGPLRQLISKESDTAKKQQYGLMYQSSERLLRLINELLNLSELETGKMQLQAVQRDVNAYVRAFGLSFESLAKIKKVDLRLDTPSEPVNCWFDPNKLEKILGNLLSNAFKFTPEGGVISLSLAYSNDKKAVEIALRDSGEGIEKAFLPQIFDRFFHAENKTADGQVGTGIGLALTKELVALHHGEIWVESQLGHGACFRFTLPLGDEHLKEEEKVDKNSIEIPSFDFEQAPLTATKVQAASNFVDGEELPKILLVEDNPEVRDFIKSYLVTHYPVVEAADGQIGLEIATEQIPDLIISDIMMPNMDGNELCQKLKEDEKTSHIPVILLTARSAKADKIQGLTIGADAYLTKPFDADELLAHISNLLENRKRLKSIFAKGTLLEPALPELPDRDQAFLQKVNTVIEAHLEEEAFGVEELLQALAMSRTQLHRKLKAITNQSTTQYMRNIRLEHARQLLERGDYNITEVAFRVGFNSQTYFSKSFKEYFGYPPSTL